MCCDPGHKLLQHIIHFCQAWSSRRDWLQKAVGTWSSVNTFSSKLAGAATILQEQSSRGGRCNLLVPPPQALQPLSFTYPSANCPTKSWERLAPPDTWANWRMLRWLHFHGCYLFIMCISIPGETSPSKKQKAPKKNVISPSLQHTCFQLDYFCSWKDRKVIVLPFSNKHIVVPKLFFNTISLAFSLSRGKEKLGLRIWKRSQTAQTMVGQSVNKKLHNSSTKGSQHTLNKL